MTFFGKTLVFLNLIFGIGTAVFATSLYTNRPAWLVDTPDGPPYALKQLAADIDASAKSAGLANVAWSTNYKTLETAESDREKRHMRMFGTSVDGTKGTKGLIDFAREGNPNPKSGAFLYLVEDPNSRLLNLNPVEDAKTVIRGPDDQPLKGTDKLLDQFVADSAEAETQAFLSKKLRGEQKVLGDQIVDVQNKIYKQRDIRDNLVVEAARLDAFEVNATEHMGIVTRRRDQLINRLAPFRSLEKK